MKVRDGDIGDKSGSSQEEVMSYGASQGEVRDAGAGSGNAIACSVHPTVIWNVDDAEWEAHRV